MLRPFDLRDIPLIRRLSEHGVSMHSKAALADGIHPLRDALLHIVTGEFPTFICKSNESGLDGFIQLHHQQKENKTHARLRYISPVDESKAVESLWFSLLDHTMQEAGQQGIHTVIAEVEETAVTLPILRQAGFAIYTRQDIYQLKSLPDPPHSPLPALSMRQESDDWDVQLLYANIVPRMVQVLTPNPPASRNGGWILREGGKLAAYIHLHTGSTATWIRLFIHPDVVSSMDVLLTAVLQLVPGKATHPVYVGVRRYQGWQKTALERAGFERVQSQAVMARHTTRQTKHRPPSLQKTSDSQRVPSVNSSKQSAKGVDIAQHRME